MSYLSQFGIVVTGYLGLEISIKMGFSTSQCWRSRNPGLRDKWHYVAGIYTEEPARGVGRGQKEPGEDPTSLI